MALTALTGIFYHIDQKNFSPTLPPPQPAANHTWQIVGKRNLLWLPVIILAVFLDPNVWHWVPAWHYQQHRFSFVREVVLLLVIGLSYRYADKCVLRDNAFSWEPLREVAFLFIGIFGTMIPAIALMGHWAGTPAGQALINPHTLYWGTGFCSSMLDNAPTYLNFLAASMASSGANIKHLSDVQNFASGGTFSHSVLQLRAVSLASVCFGAMTYIGNGPNFMVKAIAEQLGVQMPSFFVYVFRYAIPLLLPILIGIWVLFFIFA